MSNKCLDLKESCGRCGITSGELFGGCVEGEFPFQIGSMWKAHHLYTNGPKTRNVGECNICTICLAECKDRFKSYELQYEDVQTTTTVSWMSDDSFESVAILKEEWDTFMGVKFKKNQIK